MTTEERRQECEKFLTKNPWVWPAFLDTVWEAIHEKDLPRASSRMILDHLRWERHGITYGGGRIDGFKLKFSNGLTPFLARKFQEEHPDFAYFFKTKSLKDDASSIIP
jgi:hypothetical protein